MSKDFQKKQAATFKEIPVVVKVRNKLSFEEKINEIRRIASSKITDAKKHDIWCSLKNLKNEEIEWIQNELGVCCQDAFINFLNGSTYKLEEWALFLRRIERINLEKRFLND